MERETLWQVIAPHFIAGLVTRGAVVTEAAPILRWAIGKSRDELREYFCRKGWSVNLVEDSR